MKKIFLILSIAALFMGCSEEEDPNKEIEKKWENFLGTWVLKEVIDKDGVVSSAKSYCDGKQILVTFIANAQRLTYNYYNINCEEVNWGKNFITIDRNNKFNNDVQGLLYSHTVFSLTKDKFISGDINNEYNSDDSIDVTTYAKLVFVRKQ